MTFGKKLKELMEKYGQSQRGIAALSGVNYVTVNRIVNNYPYQVTPETARKLADALACTKAERQELLSLVNPTNAAIQSAIGFLESDHVQKNKHRMGLLGSQDIELAIARLKNILKG